MKSNTSRIRVQISSIVVWHSIQKKEELNTMNASQLLPYLYNMKIIVKIQKHRDRQTKWQSMEKFTRKRQKKRHAQHATIKDRNGLDLEEIGES